MIEKKYAHKSYEPRVLVSGGNPGRWSAAGKSLDDSFCNGVESWVYAFNGDYIGHKNITQKDVGRYDIIIANTNNPLRRLLHLAENRASSVTWVSLIEGSAEDYLVPKQYLKPLLDISDLVNVINGHSLSFFRALTRSRVEYIGIPYPVDGIKKLFTPFEKRKKCVFLCAPLLKRWNDYWAAKAIGVPYYGYEQRHSRKGKLLVAELLAQGTFSVDTERNIKKVVALYNDPDLEVRKSTDLKNYFFKNSSVCLWINLDNRYTWARYVLDAAALQIPIISTKSTYHGVMFFPLTTVDNALCVDKAVEIGKRLVQEKEFYQQVATYPEDKMEFLKPGPMKQALLSAIGLA